MSGRSKYSPLNKVRPDTLWLVITTCSLADYRTLTVLAAADAVFFSGHVGYGGAAGTAFHWAFEEAFISDFHEYLFTDGVGREGSWQLYIGITARHLRKQAGRAAPYVPAAPRSYAYVPVVGESIKRLPLIVGWPPFTVKPGHDRAEFGRQLAGQQTGLNELTVAAFLRNRDEYLINGRSLAGSQAQKLAREEFLQMKITQIRDENEDLSEEEATMQAKQWMNTQAALHDPDQIAGGHGHNITGMGATAVNSSIGAQWPSRISPIDEHVRRCAKIMSTQERQTTYLHVELPWN